MKGIIFTELLDFVESQLGSQGLEEILQAAGTAGTYTAVGNYPHQDAIAIVVAVSERTGIDAAELMRLYGNDLFGRLVVRYPVFFENVTGSIDFLSGIQTHIHDEVKSLYPDTTPPEFAVSNQGDSIHIQYHSHRPFAMIAHGMIEACIKHFGESLKVETSKAIGAADSQAEFLISPA